MLIICKLLIPAIGHAGQDKWVALLAPSTICHTKWRVTSRDTLALIGFDCGRGISNSVEDVLANRPCRTLFEGILLTRRAHRCRSLQNKVFGGASKR